ncbi:MAG: chemotaxis-specific protein-glutamate methyltransferase CheB [Polyangiaceae bacterium]
MVATASRAIRLLVVDDSAYNRRLISEIFTGSTEIEVVGKAADGEEALRLVTLLKPDLITLDLEMPRMDGFTFLRILMSRQPTPVIVVSSYAQKENVFKALELGALDFVTKADRQISPDNVELKEQILSKVMLVRSLKRSALVPPPTRARQVSAAFTADGRPLPIDASPLPAKLVKPKSLVAFASSTGGPTALLDIFAKIPTTSNAAFVIAQHMPDKFTRTFAERIDRKSHVRTAEAQDGDKLGALCGVVCPGRQCMEVVAQNGELKVRIASPVSTDRYVPSGDRLLKSAAVAAAAVGIKCIGVVLTGMGDDGVEGARAIFAGGGIVIAESQETAVVFGMPGSAVRANVVTRVLPLPQIADFLAQIT